MRLIYFLILLGLPSILCGQRLPLSTESDSALFYYDLAWDCVLNKGDYTGSEKAFRKMADFDPDFLVGKSLLGRISTKASEQRRMYDEIERDRGGLAADEDKLLDVFQALLMIRILRNEAPDKAPAQVKFALEMGKDNLGYLGKKYPGEFWYQAEFIESVNYIDGPQAALDSLESLNQEPLIPFLMGYKASLLMKTGGKEAAMKLSDQLFLIYPDGNIPKPFMVKADLYEQMGEKELAKAFLEKALKLDPGNIDGQRMKKRLEGE
ncbi:MAG: hypothetical protein R8P61_10430 [Bacteroidia bacterium]|nr:hypothetical protein [Bacteroidia bacterium]